MAMPEPSTGRVHLGGHTCLIRPRQCGLAAKNAKTPIRDRLYVDVPGTNLTRGLSGATMKSAEEHELQIPKTTHMQICKDMKAGLEGDGEDHGGAMAGIGSGATDNNLEQPESDNVSNVHPWPFTMSLDMRREMLNMFRGEGVTKVVNFTPGFGTLELACLAEGIMVNSFSYNATHREFLTQRLILAASVDMLRGGTKFVKRRILTRAHSLGGADSQDTETTCPRGQASDAGAAAGVSDENHDSDDGPESGED